MDWSRLQAAASVHHRHLRTKSMNFKFNLALIFVCATSLFASGCVRSSTLVGIEVPASATSVEYSSSNATGLKFTIQSQPSSYKYVDNERKQIIESGYALCKKSAISTWQPFPEPGNRSDKNKYWLIEMYTTKDKKKFILLRVDEKINPHDKLATQRFIIASQNIGSGKPNLSNINEFCGA